MCSKLANQGIHVTPTWMILSMVFSLTEKMAIKDRAGLEESIFSSNLGDKAFIVALVYPTTVCFSCRSAIVRYFRSTRRTSVTKAQTGTKGSARHIRSDQWLQNHSNPHWILDQMYGFKRCPVLVSFV